MSLRHSVRERYSFGCRFLSLFVFFELQLGLRV